jgi:predicted peroxiredoxin
MEKKGFLFVLSHATKDPMQLVALMKIATNMKAFDDEMPLDFFLVGEAVELAKKGVAESISMELEGQKVVVSEMMETLTQDFGVKFYVCHAFMPAFGVSKDDLIESAEVKSSSYLGELLLDGRTPFSLNLL